MCEVRPEVEGEEELKVLQKQDKVPQKQVKEEGKKDSAKSGGGCCEPFCNPITCGP